MRKEGGNGDVSGANIESLQVRPDGEDRPVLWDPAEAWPAGRKWIWAVLATLVVINQGPSFLHSMRTTWREGNDFFLDWSSARNVIEGRPTYLPLSVAVSLYSPRVAGGHQPIALLPWNSHPPTSVLAVLPLGLLDYPAAGTLWNLLGLLALGASVGMIVRELRFPVAAWSILPMVTLGLLCSPIRMQFVFAQWNAPLLFLLILAWVAERRGRCLCAGLLVGTAVTLKLYPIFFLLHFVIRRRWGALIAGSLWICFLTLVTVAILGPDAYRDYFNQVLPTFREWRSWWANTSVLAFWTKNLATGADHWGLHVEPVIRAPRLAYVGIVLSFGAVLATWVYNLNKLNNNDINQNVDICYAATSIVTLLLTPVCWDQYLALV